MNPGVQYSGGYCIQIVKMCPIVEGLNINWQTLHFSIVTCLFKLPNSKHSGLVFKLVRGKGTENAQICKL